MATHPADNPALRIFWKNRYAPPAGIASALLLILSMAPERMDENRQLQWATFGIILIIAAVLDVVRPSFGTKVTKDGLPASVHLHAGLSGCWLGGAILIDPDIARTNEYAYLVAVLVLGTMIGLLQFGTLGRQGPILMTSSVITSSIGFTLTGHAELALGGIVLLAIGLRATTASAKAYLELLVLRSEGLDREKSATWYANHDPLTKVLNRRGLAGWLDAERPESRRATHCLFIDLDHFKVVNDSHGHDVGDEILATTARRLTDLVGDSGAVARLGGDEFVVLVHDGRRAGEMDVPELAQRILTTLRQPLPANDTTIAVSASVGVVPAGTDESLRDLLRRGDAALYDAKARGRDQVVATA